MGVVAEGIPRGCQGLFTPVSLGYPLSVFNKNSTLKGGVLLGCGFRDELPMRYSLLLTSPANLLVVVMKVTTT